MSQLSKVVKENLVFINQKLKDKDSIIDFFSNEVFKQKLIIDKTEFKETIFEREKEVSTSIGYGIAMPHGKSSTVIDPFIGFMRLDDEIKWSDQNEDLIKMIFLIGVPNENQNELHLKFISELSKKLLDDQFRNDLKTIDNKKDVFRILNEVNMRIENN